MNPRAIWTLTVTIVLTTLEGVAVLTISRLLPSRWGFEPLFRSWSRGILAAAGARLTIRRTAPLPPRENYFLVGNHQSVMDIPAIAVAMRGRVRFMAKKSLFHIPMLGWSMRCAGFVPIDRSSARRAKIAVDAMLKRLRHRPVSIVVFPEGTRTSDGALQPFRRGAMQVCRRSGLPVVPFAIEGAFQVHRRRTWRIRPGPIQLRLGEPMSSSEVQRLRPDELARRVREEVARLLAEARRAAPVENSAVATSWGGTA